jgi:hypothetical protein
MLASLQSALPVTMNPFNRKTTQELVARFLRNLILGGVFNSNYSQMPILVKTVEQYQTLYMKTYTDFWSCQVAFVRKLLNHVQKPF